MIYGTLDIVALLEPVRRMVQKWSMNVIEYVVVDDHRLHKTVHQRDWASILE
jgi:hypothetical protein